MEARTDEEEDIADALEEIYNSSPEYLLDIAAEGVEAVAGGAASRDDAGLASGALVNTAGIAGPSSSNTAAHSARLTELVDLIDNRRVWKVCEAPEHDAALLLLDRDSPQLANVPRRAEANKVLARGPCVFFVDKTTVADGKRKRVADGAVATDHAALVTLADDLWIKKTASSASGSSVLPCGLPGYENVAVLRLSCGLGPEEKREYGEKTIGEYSLVITPGHRDWDGSGVTKTAGHKKTEYRIWNRFGPHRKLIHCMPKDELEDSQEAPKRDATFGKIEVDELKSDLKPAAAAPTTSVSDYVVIKTCVIIQNNELIFFIKQ